MNTEEAIDVHAEGGHYVLPVGAETALENQDLECAASVALGDGLAADGHPLVNPDGSHYDTGNAGALIGISEGVCSPPHAESSKPRWLTPSGHTSVRG